MTPRELAVQTAASMKGQRDQVVDLYNTYLPRPRGYKVKYSDQLCATYSSTPFIVLGWTDIVPPECAAWRLYKNMDALGCAVWGNNRTPLAGDLIFFGVGDSVSKIDHVGIVDHTEGSTIYFWDIRSVVALHSYKPGTKTSVKAYGYILGYGVPDYKSADAPQPEPGQNEIKTGDLVTVNPGARWYKGQTIKASVFDDQWYVLSVKGDRVVLGMNLAETRNIQSPIHAADLTLVTPNEPTATDKYMTISVTIHEETYQLLKIIADGNHWSIGQVIDKELEDYR